MDILPILVALKRQKTAALLITLEIALCCAILCNALFLIVTRLERSNIDSGLAESQILRIQSAGLGRDDDASVRGKTDVAALRALPGVVDATLTNQVSFGRSSWNSSVQINPDDRHSVANVGAYYGDEQLLETLGLQLVAGRDFKHDEYIDFTTLLNPGAERPQVVIITRTLGRTLFADADPLGKTFYLGEDSPVRVVGVVNRLLRPRFDQDLIDADNSMILPVRLPATYGMYLIRVAPGQQQAVLEAAQARLRELAPNRLILKAENFSQIRETYFKQDRVMAGLLIAVVISLLVVTALGIVGLASFWVQRRRRQIGIRRALGATRGQILRDFQLENFLIVSLGIVLGMLSAYAISGWLMHHYALPALPLYYLPAGALALWLLGQLAVLSPALRAAAIPPATATRSV